MITVIIPVYNEEKFISGAINSILNQDIKDENYEILITDGMSNDKTRQIIKNFQRENGNIFFLNTSAITVFPDFNLAVIR